MRRPAEVIQSQQPAPVRDPRFDAREVLETIARPRLTGSAGSAEVVAELTRRLESSGYEVRPSTFHFSSWPGRFGVSLAGVFYAAGTFLAMRVMHQGHPGIALVLLLTLAFIVGGIAVLAKPAIDMLPLGRVQGVNLLAHVPGSRPRYYLIAHHDSKSQPIPLAFRGPAIALAGLAWLALVVLATIALVDPIWSRAAIVSPLGLVAVASGVILIFCWVDNRSPGALDNGSGVATLLGVAQREASAGDVAFIITDAEELGLAGARAIAPHLPASFGVINVDGIDDNGTFYVVERFGWPKKRGAAPHLAAAVLGAAETLKLPAHRRDVPLGLLLDHIPMVQAGIPAISLMRGRFSSLARVHRPADNLDNISGTGVEQAVNLLSAALDQLRRPPQ